MPEGDSFLPRVQSVFYAVFDVKQGPKVVYQVPEGLISVTSTGPPSSGNINNGCSVPPTPSSETSPPVVPTGSFSNLNGLTSRNSSTSLASPTDFYRPGGRHLSSPQKRSNSSQRTLFNFNDISMFVIPHQALCGRLVTCATRRHRIIGFPVELKGNYTRNYFRYNLCFVFEREADLSCYEPVVRKISRVLKACEEESHFLSSPNTSPAVHAILEQLYEDLNSYSETSISIDQFNSIELKIFPFYPNPPPLRDWMVPLALINLPKRVEDNWDLTVLKVSKFIDGINHVSRIAHLADCDLALTRQAISHLLYYQVIMMIDIFQYSNMYTLKKSVQWLADEAHVKEECGPYVTKPGKTIPDWPRLLHLYSRLKPGKTIFDWMKSHDVESLGIDVRRFTSFGVIKGFLRRVHRYPVYISPDPDEIGSNEHIYPLESPIEPITHSVLARKRGKSLSAANGQQPIIFPTPPADVTPHETDAPPSSTISASHRARRASAAEKVLEQLRSRDMQKSGTNALASQRNSWINFPHESLTNSSNSLATVTNALNGSVVSLAGISATLPSTGVAHASPTKNASTGRDSRRQSLIAPVVPPSSPIIAKMTLTPSRPLNQAANITSQPSVPPSFKSMLDGEHHTDELSVKFEAGWPLLEQWLRTIGGGQGENDYGRVVIICK
ncbi:Nitrogen permease regulator 2-like protein [Psilocybe cubensis]|uniref:Nitrogen permease regulator 2-like protein n=2 Tax=Psilocybe cubensis TaxID=181762 RepID=A0ACB8HAD5_PSICU|nr:Nitrogen permease regulator 2-like protein [Psilocybe cubensis]KAH9484115.1 Nitrogen permease regulator 2-like protein [Psilocybe cubensis]